MAKHFKQEGTAPQAPAPIPRPTRGGDESYHAPAGNAYARTSSRAVGYQSVVAPGHGASGRRRSGYGESDPYDVRGNRDPKRRRARIVSRVLLVIGLCLLIAAAGMFLHNQYEYHEQDVINEKLAAYATVDNSGSSAPQVDWAALKAVNQQVVGWIQIPGTNVNYPVYQGADNDAYLHTNAEGNYSLGGQIFLDTDNTAPGMVDAQTIIYGHHLRNGSMFKAVSDMESQGMFDSVDTIW